MEMNVDYWIQKLKHKSACIDKVVGIVRHVPKARYDEPVPLKRSFRVIKVFEGKETVIALNLPTYEDGELVVRHVQRKTELAAEYRIEEEL